MPEKMNYGTTFYKIHKISLQYSYIGWVLIKNILLFFNVFVIHYCVTNFPKTYCLKQQQIIIISLSFYESEI